jgi:heme-degrading monooxygenase HmoA
MIARIWRGLAAAENARLYRQHAIERVFPLLATLPGYRGAYLLRRETDGQVEFLALTRWD